MLLGIASRDHVWTAELPERVKETILLMKKTFVSRLTHRSPASAPVWCSPAPPGPSITPAIGPLGFSFLVGRWDGVLLLPCQLSLREALHVCIISASGNDGAAVNADDKLKQQTPAFSAHPRLMSY